MKCLNLIKIMSIFFLINLALTDAFSKLKKFPNRNKAKLNEFLDLQTGNLKNSGTKLTELSIIQKSYLAIPFIFISIGFSLSILWLLLLILYQS